MNTKYIQLPFHSILCLLFLFFLGTSSCSEDPNQPNCSIDCLNGGISNNNCDCLCPPEFTGNNCEMVACDLQCENGGDLNDDNCTCDCPNGFEGDECEDCIAKCNLVYRTEYWVSPGGVFVANDYASALPDKYVLTGLGFNSSTTLKIIGRELLEDCTLGESVEFFDGTNPSGELAVFYEVPDGHAITGVGYGEINGDYRLVVNYNELLSDEECELYLGPELLYDNNNTEVSVNRWLKVSDSSLETRFHLFGGLGIRFSGNNRQIFTEIREIINLF